MKNKLKIAPPSALDKLRTEADAVQAHWKEAKSKLDAAIAASPDGGANPDSALQFLIDHYNSINNNSHTLQHRLAELERRETDKSKFSNEKSISTEFEERTFWFRRFHTSLAIAHGGAFAAIASHLFDKDTTAATAAAAWYPMAFFGAGMIVAGILPVALHRRSERTAWWLAGLSSALFVAGLCAALLAIWLKAELTFKI